MAESSTVAFGVVEQFSNPCQVLLYMESVRLTGLCYVSVAGPLVVGELFVYLVSRIK